MLRICSQTVLNIVTFYYLLCFVLRWFSLQVWWRWGWAEGMKAGAAGMRCSRCTWVKNCPSCISPICLCFHWVPGEIMRGRSLVPESQISLSVGLVQYMSNRACSPTAGNAGALAWISGHRKYNFLLYRIILPLGIHAICFGANLVNCILPLCCAVFSLVLLVSYWVFQELIFWNLLLRSVPSCTFLCSHFQLTVSRMSLKEMGTFFMVWKYGTFYPISYCLILHSMSADK